jgi:hypothetical protein
MSVSMMVKFLCFGGNGEYPMRTTQFIQKKEKEKTM